MSGTPDRQKSELLKRVVTEAGKRLKGAQSKAALSFIKSYYEYVPPSDILDMTPDTLFAAAMAHWKLGAKRKPETCQVKVYNPSLEANGWACDHTVVEIVTDDMPFLVDSVTAALNSLDVTVHIAIHPIYHVKRDKAGNLKSIDVAEAGKSSGTAESFMHFQVTEQSKLKLDAIKEAIEDVLNDVRFAVADWMAIRGKLQAVIDGLTCKTTGLSKAQLDEDKEFLQWIHDNHFTLIGYRDYSFKAGKSKKVEIARSEGLGILRDPKRVVFQELRDEKSVPIEVKAFINHDDALMVTKSNVKSTVHRPVHMDAICVKRYDAKGNVTGQRVFVGLFTSVAYNRSPMEIPLLRGKLKKALELSGLPPKSHDYKALANILETFPRDELFQVSTEHLYHTSMGILHLQDRQQVALFIRRDELERFLSCLIYVPRDRYTTSLRFQMQSILEKAFKGTVSSYYTLLGDSPLARLHIIVQIEPGKMPTYDPVEIEKDLKSVARSWTDHLQEALVAAFGEEKGLSLTRRYAEAFPSGYTEHYNAQTAVMDINKAEMAFETGCLSMSLFRSIEEPENHVRFKIYHCDGPVPLSDALPMIEHMGLKVVDEIPNSIMPKGGGSNSIWIHDFGLETRDGSDVDLGNIRENFQDAFLRVWQGDVESDGFNALVLHAGLTWREVVVLRAYCKYLRQAGIAYSQNYMEQTLSNNPLLARLIVDLFTVRFDPDAKAGRKEKQAKIREAIDQELEQVVSADDDKIIRRFVNLVESSLRTNYFQEGNKKSDGPKGYLSFKLDSSKVEELPLPRPLREIFVYSPRVEGVHLRFGMVARGGLRWSDRREDFRTEVLGLVKAQQVKNTVIVPVGSKGGFVVKQPPADGGRDAFMEEGINCYKTFISGMLDITDNLKGDKVIPPKLTVRHDGDDPYLVVAADKGTATFSDIANGVSLDYDFWLGDAFASGGSVGYDHKKMGITARGAWESVKRHFREMGINTQEEDFTCVGVGDMSGDVFGNGMLLSEHIRLVAAFNHMHIFVDPEPDAKKSFKERKRLFDLPRSSWTDYDNKLISKGGGIFERSAKSVKLTPEIKKRFNLIKDTVTPNELIRAILTSQVDLLWFGGIGTYIRASHETNADAGDRANDAIRVTAAELRCDVVGEGANLGVTQRGRIEYALGGGRINTDSIDNSAGVDCSDHEVNIKILLDSVVNDGDMTQKQRNKLLAEMTDEVGELVLRDNYMQTQAMSAILAKGHGALEDQSRLMRSLERMNRLNREVEYLPDEETLAERIAAKQSLVRPEIAILMSYSKIWLYDEILATDLPDDKYLDDDLITYFPTPLRTRFKTNIHSHRLRREIIATRVTNSLINRVGGTFITHFMEKTGMTPPDIARAYTIARQVFALREIWDDIEALDNKVPAEIQTAMLLDVNLLAQWGTLWFLRNGDKPLDIGNHIKEFQKGMAELSSALTDVLPAHYGEDIRNRARRYLDAGVPENLALRVSGLVNLLSGCDIVRLASRRKMKVLDIGKLYFAVGAKFKLGRMRAATDKLETQNHWQSLASAALIEELYDHQLALTAQVLDITGETEPDKALPKWMEEQEAALERTDQLLSELWAGEINDLSMVAVASRSLRSLAGSVALRGSGG